MPLRAPLDVGLLGYVLLAVFYCVWFCGEFCGSFRLFVKIRSLRAKYDTTPRPRHQNTHRAPLLEGNLWVPAVLFQAASSLGF
jgi:hypothetical protein